MVLSIFRLDGETLVYEMNKPFGALAEGLIFLSSRGDWTPVELFIAAVNRLVQLPAQRLD